MSITPDLAALRVTLARDYYAVLNVPPGASLEQLKAAHRELARALHPDLCSRPDAASLCSAVNWKTLCETNNTKPPPVFGHVEVPDRGADETTQQTGEHHA